MQHFLYPALFALFVWWFSTGAIIFLDQLPRATFKYSMVGATLVLLASFWGIAASAHDTSLVGAYCAFSCGLLAWGWQEISFYMGFVTGPRTAPCPEGCSGWKHFIHAIQTSLWHELAIIAAALVVTTLTWNQPNHVGLWTFMVLWWMHQSAKLNVFLGVRNLNEEFLPDHLAFLRSFLTKKPMNLLFPFSVTISSVICVVMWERATAPGATHFTQAGRQFRGHHDGAGDPRTLVPGAAVALGHALALGTGVQSQAAPLRRAGRRRLPRRGQNHLHAPPARRPRPARQDRRAGQRFCRCRHRWRAALRPGCRRRRTPERLHLLLAEDRPRQAVAKPSSAASPRTAC